MLNIPRANLNNYYDEMHTDKRPSKGVFFGVKTIFNCPYYNFNANNFFDVLRPFMDGLHRHLGSGRELPLVQIR
jgi:hypothetical protein